MKTLSNRRDVWVRQAGAIEDEADDNDTPDDEIELTPLATVTGQSSLKKMMRSFLEMFSLDKGSLILNMMTDSNW